MGRKFGFVVGDRGAAAMVLPVVRELRHQGHDTLILADAAGIGGAWLQDHDESVKIVGGLDQAYVFDLTDMNAILVGTCATANKLEIAVAQQFAGLVPIIAGSDGLFNHALPAWRDVEVSRWLAIDAGHAVAMQSLRPKRSVTVTGQPAFDEAVKIVTPVDRRPEVRAAIRSKLGIVENSTVALWWSTGMAEIIDEDMTMAGAALDRLADYHDPVFIAMLHPKLEQTMGVGFVAKAQGLFRSVCEDRQVRFLAPEGIVEEQLNFAADLIMAATSTADVKNTLVGGPPVMYLLGKQVQQWMMRELQLRPPFFLPDIAAKRSLAAFNEDDMERTMGCAFNPQKQAHLLAGWAPPRELATPAVVRLLTEVATS